MITFQDYQQAGNKVDFIKNSIIRYRSSELFETACVANDYEAQRNRTISQYTKYLYSLTGRKIVDAYSANNRIASNLFHRLNKQRCSYLLGNGVFFNEESTKERMGRDFDRKISDLGYYALIHGVSYGFWNKDRLEVFRADEVCPIWDEYTGKLRACIRFWSLDWARRPVTVEFYEEDGYTVYRTKGGSSGLDIEEYQPKRPYILRVVSSQADGDVIAGGDNYGTLPVIPMWGGMHKQSTLVGMRAAIDALDLIKSGFANDLQDCAQIYWLISGNFGMDDGETQRFLDRLKLQHVVNVEDQASVQPYTQEIPYAARESFLIAIRKSIYDDFGALDVTSISAGSKTATEIESAYQPMDEEADDFEYQVSSFILQLLALLGIDDVPTYDRNRIINQREQTEMVMMAAQYLDDETVLKKLPFVTVDEIANILGNRDAEDGDLIPQEETEE